MPVYVKAVIYDRTEHILSIHDAEKAGFASSGLPEYRKFPCGTVSTVFIAV